MGVSYLSQAKIVNCNQILGQDADQNCEVKFHMNNLNGVL